MGANSIEFKQKGFTLGLTRTSSRRPNVKPLCLPFKKHVLHVFLSKEHVFLSSCLKEHVFLSKILEWEQQRQYSYHYDSHYYLQRQSHLYIVHKRIATCLHN